MSFRLSHAALRVSMQIRPRSLQRFQQYSHVQWPSLAAETAGSLPCDRPSWPKGLTEARGEAAVVVSPEGMSSDVSLEVYLQVVSAAADGVCLVS